ncbi:MAG: pyridoxamine kinase [Clostridia bacterium]|nr:pyridoxamine kinase [Clostridia bacterium]
MESKQKRAIAIHDISCAGRCSLTVALPVLSVQGIETNVIPTAILSTQTGGFEGYTYRDLTEDILPIVRHWTTLNRTCDAIYTGFLGSFRQLEIISQVIDLMRGSETLIYIDPVMGDGGKLYSTFDMDFVSGMRALCKNAHVITPNVTEAFLLLGRPYQEGPYSQTLIEELLRDLSELGPETVVLTGIYPDGEHLGAAAYDQVQNRIYTAYASAYKGTYHGAGDLFGSVLLGKMLQNIPLDEALKASVDFTAKCIQRTGERGVDTRFGLEFETFLGELAPNGSLV